MIKISWEAKPRIDLTLGLIHTGSVSMEWCMNFAQFYTHLNVTGKRFYMSYSRGAPYDISRSHCVDDCLKQGAEWLLFIDSDVIIPPDLFDRLVSKNVPVCVTGETVVSGSNVKISKLKPSDMVLSKSGKEQFVEETYRREYLGKLIKVKVRGLLPVTMTPEHPVLVAKVVRKDIPFERVCLKCGGKGTPYIATLGTNHLRYLCFEHHKDCYIGSVAETRVLKVCPKCGREGRPRIKAHGKRKYLYFEHREHCYLGPWRKMRIIGWRKAEDLQEQDYVAIPRIKTEEETSIKLPYKRQFSNVPASRFKVELDKDIARLFGLYVAEGFIDHDYREVHFSLNINEEELATYIERFLKEKFGINCYRTTREEDNSLVVNAMSTGLARFLESEFGRGAKNKCIPSFIKRSPKSIVRAFIDGWHKGDGDIQEDGDLRIVTASKRLTYDFLELLIKIGIMPCIQLRRQGESNIRGRKVRSTISYTIGYSGLAWNGRADRMGRKRSIAIFDESFVYLPIRKVETFYGKTKVYNLKTEDETFCVPFVVHNCSALYYRRHKPLHPAMWRAVPKGTVKCPTCDQLYSPWARGKYNPLVEYPRGALIECDVIGMGAALIHRSVLERVHHPPDDPLFIWTAGREGILKEPILTLIEGKGTSEDFYACERIKSAGFKIYCATDIVLEHETTLKVTAPEMMSVDDVKWGGFTFPNI